MARPIKRGLDYFPLAVRAFEDEKLDDLHYDYGPMAQHIFVRILMLIYANGYYLELTETKLVNKLHKVLGPKWIERTEIELAVRACVNLGLFDKDLFEEGVITSPKIQEQFIFAAKRRKEVDISKYWLLDSNTMKKLGILLSMDKNKDKNQKKQVNVNNNSVNVSNNSVNVDNNTQRKRKSKRDILIKKDKSIYGYPKMHFLTQLIIDRKYISEVDANIMKYNILFETAILDYGYENVLSGVNYLISYAKNPTPPIDDKYSFMKASLITNLERFKKLEDKGGIKFEEWFKNGFLQVDR
jgi:hypothetical protein